VRGSLRLTRTVIICLFEKQLKKILIALKYLLVTLPASSLKEIEMAKIQTLKYQHMAQMTQFVWILQASQKITSLQISGLSSFI